MDATSASPSTDLISAAAAAVIAGLSVCGDDVGDGAPAARNEARGHDDDDEEEEEDNEDRAIRLAASAAESVSLRVCQRETRTHGPNAMVVVFFFFLPSLQSLPLCARGHEHRRLDGRGHVVVRPVLRLSPAAATPLPGKNRNGAPERLDHAKAGGCTGNDGQCTGAAAAGNLAVVALRLFAGCVFCVV